MWQRFMPIRLMHTSPKSLYKITNPTTLLLASSNFGAYFENTK